MDRWESPLTDMDVAARLTDMIAEVREMAGQAISPGTEQTLMACADTLARLTVLVMVRGRSVSIDELREMATKARAAPTSGHAAHSGTTDGSAGPQLVPLASEKAAPKGRPSSG